MRKVLLSLVMVLVLALSAFGASPGKRNLQNAAETNLEYYGPFIECPDALPRWGKLINLSDMVDFSRISEFCPVSKVEVLQAVFIPISPTYAYGQIVFLAGWLPMSPATQQPIQTYYRFSAQPFFCPRIPIMEPHFFCFW